MELQNDNLINSGFRTAHEYFGLFTARRGPIQPLANYVFENKCKTYNTPGTRGGFLRWVRSGQVLLSYLNKNNSLPFHWWHTGI